MKKLLTTTALVLSLTFSGMALAYDGGDKGEHGGFMKEAFSKLPQDKAEAFRNTLKESREKNKASHEQIKKLHDELYTIMTAPTFDKKAYLAKSGEIQALKDKMHKAKTAAFATGLSNLTQEERTSVADSLREMHKKFAERHDKKPDGDDKPVGDAQ